MSDLSRPYYRTGDRPPEPPRPSQNSIDEAVALLRGASRPVEALAATARRIAAGDYSPPDPIRQHGEIGVLAAAFANMTQAIGEREERIRFQSGHDGATGLPNRVLFHEQLEQALTGIADGQQLAVLCLDVDHFKGVNDTLGHPIGDLLLKQAATRLADCAREIDTVARLGGDEFASACIVASSQELVVVAQELAETLFDPISLDGVTVRVGASIGVSISPDHGLSHSDLLRSADVAMYEAKRSRSIVAVYQAGVVGSKNDTTRALRPPTSVVPTMRASST